MSARLPVAVIGAGPVGLAAAAHLVEAGLDAVVFEAGDSVANNVTGWGHVRLFSPWRYNIDAAAARLLGRSGWEVPDLDDLPTGRQLVEQYLLPLSGVPALTGRVRLGARVGAVSRTVDKMTGERSHAPYVLRVHSEDGEDDILARAVIDASGTWRTPNPLGANGLPALGEAALRSRLRYGIPDVLGQERELFAGRTTAVVGSGHSAANALLALLALRSQDPGTAIHWVIRGSTPRAYGGGSSDQLEARGRLGSDAASAVRAGLVALHEQFRVREVSAAGGHLQLVAANAAITGLDHVIVATGQRPDLSLAAELRLSLDEGLDCSRALGPLIDPNLHSCGTVRPHGYPQLEHPDSGFFVAGAKSYGRAPTFLVATGYEQVRSIAAHLAGDEDRARRVHLVLPESGVCATGAGAAALCC